MLIISSISSSAQNSKTEFELQRAGNAFSSIPVDGSTTITQNGMENWTNPKEYLQLTFEFQHRTQNSPFRMDSFHDR